GTPAWLRSYLLAAVVRIGPGPQRKHGQGQAHPQLERRTLGQRGSSPREMRKAPDPLGRPLALRHCLASFLAHEGSSEGAFGPVLVVRAAAKPHPLDARLSSARDLVHMVEFDVAARGTAPALWTDARTLAPIPLPHGALDRGRDVALP